MSLFRTPALRGALRRLGVWAAAAVVLWTIARLIPVELTAAHTGRIARPRRFAEVAPAGPAVPDAILRGTAPPSSTMPAASRDHVTQDAETHEPSELRPATWSAEPPASQPPGLRDLLDHPVIDLNGRIQRPGASANGRAVALVFLSPGCPISNGSIPELNRLAASFGSRGVEFFGIVADGAESRAAASDHYRAYEPAFPMLFDASGDWLRRLQPTHVPQCFVIDRDGRVRYSGRLDDEYVSLGRRRPEVGQRFLSAALEDLLAGRRITVAVTEPIGCLIEDREPAGDRDVTWCRDVAPIVFANCVTCHRPGEVGPFPLLAWDDVRRRARQIALVAAERIMPPWQPELGFGHFQRERRLTAAQIETLANWAAAGAPHGDLADLPPLPEFVDGWRLGTPDLVLELPTEFEVPADGNDIYQYFVLPTGLTADQVITAIEFRPTSPQVVHHASFCYDTSGEARRLDESDPGPGYRRFGGAGFAPDGSLGGWAPGVTPQHLPEGLGRKIARGSDVVVQVHYHPIGRRVRDRSRIGLHFAHGPVRQHLTELLVANMNLRIPAGAEGYVHRASYTLPVDVTVHAVAPHMHLLGREFTATATRPDGGVEPLVRIADWDFNWQDVYFYARPLRLPAGTRIDIECVYDNSPSNPFNPSSPPMPVQWGERSIDEMGICYLDVTTDNPDDRQRLISDNQAEIARQIREHPWLLEPPAEFRPDTP